MKGTKWVLLVGRCTKEGTITVGHKEALFCRGQKGKLLLWGGTISFLGHKKGH